MNMILKRAASSVIAAIMAAGFISVPFMASAKDPVQLTVTSVKGESGKDVVVSMNISANSGLAATDLILKYDSSKLIYKNDAPGSAAEGGFFSNNPAFKTEDGSAALRIAFIHPDGVMAEGSLLDITFTVASGWSGSSALTLEINGDIVDSAYKTISYEIKDGTVSVGTESDSNAATTASDSTVKKSSQKILIILLTVVCVLAVGVAAAYIVMKKR